MKNKKNWKKLLIEFFLLIAAVVLTFYLNNKKNVVDDYDDVDVTKNVEYVESQNVEDGGDSEENELLPYTELTTYEFRTSYLKKEHYKKHGKEMGFKNADDYEKAANNVINSEMALIKQEKEDGDYIYYIVETNEIVFLSLDGYIRTYFKPDSGKKYFDKQ